MKKPGNLARLNSFRQYENLSRQIGHPRCISFTHQATVWGWSWWPAVEEWWWDCVGSYCMIGLSCGGSARPLNYTIQNWPPRESE